MLTPDPAPLITVARHPRCSAPGTASGVWKALDNQLPRPYHRSIAWCLKPTNLCTHLGLHLALPVSCVVTNHPEAHEDKTTHVDDLTVSASPGTVSLSPPAQDCHQGQAVTSSETGLREDPKLM